jgi:hypothetical protein
MTAHTHDRSRITPDTDDGPQDPASRSEAAPNRRRWLVPGTIAIVAAAGLVVAGVVPLGTVISVGLFGGMMLMHLGGHGMHGGHGTVGHSHDRDDEAATVSTTEEQQPGSPEGARSSHGVPG